MKYFAIFFFALSSLFARAAELPDYKLGAGDVIRVTVYDHPDLANEIQISKGGAINFPLIGRVTVDGLSTREAEQLIAQRLQKGNFIKEPNVNVLITQFKSKQISILGEVNRPGRYTLEGTTDLVEAVALAGGVAQTGGTSAILIRGGVRNEIALQQQLDGAAVDFKPVDVFAGDVIYVPRAKQFYIYGEVNRPGAYRLEPNLNVVQAIATGGGLTAKASSSKFKLLRKQADGSVREMKVSKLDLIQSDDVIYVKESLF